MTSEGLELTFALNHMAEFPVLTEALREEGVAFLKSTRADWAPGAKAPALRLPR